MPNWLLYILKLGLLFVTVGICCVFLVSSTTHSPHILNFYISTDNNSNAYQGLWPAAKNGETTALHQLVEIAFIEKDQYWLKQAASINNLAAQLHLAELANNQQEKLYWWQQAALNQHSPSLFELSLVEKNPNVRIDYLSQAANAHYPPAVIALSKYWYDLGNQEQALIWLKQATKYDKHSEFLLARLLWNSGQLQQAKVHFTNAASTVEQAKEYARVVDSMQQQEINALSSQQQVFTPQCAQQLQFVATSLDSAVQASRFKQTFSKDARFSKLPICINSIIWLKPNELNCQLVEHRQRCDFNAVVSKTFAPNYTHLVLFLPSGTAYVQHGLMHLDQADTYSVFVHELAHFVGFLDEYAILPQLAKQYCYHTNAPNLLLGEEIYQSPTFANWQNYASMLPHNEGLEEQRVPSPELTAQSGLALSESRTCAKLGIKAYKPSNSITFLEHHDTEHIPPIYLLMWKDRLNDDFHRVAVEEHFYNVSMDMNLSTAADHWLGIETLTPASLLVD